MSSILGHGLAGILIASTVRKESDESKRRLLMFVALLAILPDVDVLIYIFFGAMGLTPHRGITHTLLFALLIGTVFSLMLGHYFALSFRAGCLLFSAVLLSHLALDYLMGSGPVVPFLWPFSDDGYLSPYKIVPTAYYSTSSAGLISLIFHIPTIFGLVMECLIFSPLILILNRKWTLPNCVGVTISASALALSVAIYNQIH